MRPNKTLIALAAISFVAPTMAEQKQALCDMYHRVSMGSTKIQALDAVGKPYNETFEIKPEGKKTQYRFELNKEKFIELYLTFDDEGKLNSKNLAGAYCPKD